jgi:hypothetical protein
MEFGVSMAEIARQAGIGTTMVDMAIEGIEAENITE